MARIKRMGEVYSSGDVKVTLAGLYDIDPSAISYGYKYAHEYQRGLKRKPRGWRMGGVEYESSLTLPLDIASELESKFGDLALVRPFPVNVTFFNYENNMIHDLIWLKFQGNKRDVKNDGELENEFEMFVLDMALNVG